MSISNTLAERAERYGDFRDHSLCSQDLQIAMRSHKNWNVLKSYHKESLMMIQHKVARILNGDPDYDDNWHDIAGYATLVENIINEMD